MPEIKYEITEHVGVISETARGIWSGCQNRQEVLK